ncbi:MAG TPA: cytochrome P450 [Trebonia sp.]|jgi:cytochrome P450|nr:cytochrome P450 [Trebonia sp.]
MTEATIFDQILDPASRANPYPLYAELRKTPVTRQADGMYVVSTYDEIVALLHDRRVSSDPRSHPEFGGSAPGYEGEPGLPLSFINRDPPGHDQLRSLAMRPFGPPCTPGRIDGMRPWLTEVANGLIDKMAGEDQVDMVEDFAYPLPVTAICQLLGVPLGDQPRFHAWADMIIETVDPATGTFGQRMRRRDQVHAEMSQYIGALADAYTRQPGDDLISGLLTDTGPDAPMTRGDLVATAALLLVAGHETTVNLISNGMLTLLRHPDVLDRLRQEPGMITRLVEELLRYEPPVQMRTNRCTVADIDIAGTTIPAGSPLALVHAAANRDPGRFADPERFDPDRAENQHIAFNSGIHYCFGAPLARVEAQVALPLLAQRLVNPRLVADPPPYRPNPELRGPRQLNVELDAIVPAAQVSYQPAYPGRRT